MRLKKGKLWFNWRQLHQMAVVNFPQNGRNAFNHVAWTEVPEESSACNSFHWQFLLAEISNRVETGIMKVYDRHNKTKEKRENA
jgi:hypothetical protein